MIHGVFLSRARLSRSLVTLAILLSALPALCAEPDEGFVPLFNDKDLMGWKGDPQLWSVQEGIIVGSTEGVTLKQNSFLSTEKTYSDFVLRAKVKLRNHNSGIQFRSEQLPDYAVAGYQADVAEQTYFGMLYEERKRGILDYWKAMTQEQRDAIQALVKKGDWNEYEITCQGDHVKMVLNGQTTCDLDDPTGAKGGIIALQLHAGPAMMVSFKDLSIKELKPAADKQGMLMPDFEEQTERLSYNGARFMFPEGFTVEEVATDEVAGSVINMTFDHMGRPIVSSEKKGLSLLIDADGDGKYESAKEISDTVRTAMGLHVLAPGDILAHANGPDGAALYRMLDTNGDDVADEVKTIGKSDGGIGEHGPHAMFTGLDGYIYVLYGNHSKPSVKLNPLSPSRGLQEDHLLPRYVDPRGHAVHVTAPGGTIHRLDPDLANWNQVVGGYRNAYDMAINAMGEMFTFDADMEWDIGLPWFRPVRVVHAVPGGDYGWRTGSTKTPAWEYDKLPPVDDVGRGSPVGVCFYHHNAFPPQYQDAFFLGDWSRGRIRVIFPKRAGATYSGKTVDFLVGQPLNVTDIDIGPDGALYFSVGGRSTHGGVYRVRYTGAVTPPSSTTPIDAVLNQPMHRSAWGEYAIQQAKSQMGEAAWADGLTAAAKDASLAGMQRVKALELLQTLGPKPDKEFLVGLLTDADGDVRATAVFLLGTLPFKSVREPLVGMLRDADPFVARRTCEALVRAGLKEGTRVKSSDPLVGSLLKLMNSDDRFLRYAARHALMRIGKDAWRGAVLSENVETRPHAALEGILALIQTQETAGDADIVFETLEMHSRKTLSDQALLDYLRAVQLAFLRDVTDEERTDFINAVGPALLAKFPTQDWKANRELQVVLAHMQTPGAIQAMLDYLSPDESQEEQIHTVYCLRAIKNGWTPEQRAKLTEWFDRGWTFAGGASFEGYIGNMWADSLALMTDDEKQLAEARKKTLFDKRAADALALLERIEGESPSAGTSELAQLSQQEIGEYLEYDPGAYSTSEKSMESGKNVFIKSRCINCHVFGTVGKGGGPDLSTVVSRFRRKDILEAIMYPSKVISDQYIGLDVELDDLTTVTGMVATESDATLTVITSNGQRVDIPKNTITARKPAKNSVMPEGLLNTMGLGELASLMNFLEHGAEQ